MAEDMPRPPDGLGGATELILREARRSPLAPQTLDRFEQIAERFTRFLERGYAIDDLAAVNHDQVESFVRASSGGRPTAIATMHLRRSMVRLYFRLARAAGLVERDPTVDLALPRRPTRRARALTDDEIEVCRSYSQHTLSSTRLPAAFALSEATARTAELPHVRVKDVDLDEGRVWIHGATKTEPRFGYLTEWGTAQIARRMQALDQEPDARLVSRGGGSDYSRQASSCMAVTEVLKRAGLFGEPDVRPISVVAWTVQHILEATGQIEEVARRLGMQSLDSAAALVGWDWRENQAA